MSADIADHDRQALVRQEHEIVIVSAGRRDGKNRAGNVEAGDLGRRAGIEPGLDRAGRQQFLLDAQLLLALRDIAKGDDGADRGAIVPQRIGDKLDRQRGAVAAAEARLLRVLLLVHDQRRQMLRRRGHHAQPGNLAGRRDQRQPGQAQEVGAIPAQHLLRGAVGESDALLQIDADDAVPDGVQDQRQLVLERCTSSSARMWLVISVEMPATA